MNKGGDTRTRQSIGSHETAQLIARRAISEVKAYGAFLASRGVPPDAALDALPVQDKYTYMKQYPFRDLLGSDHAETFAIFKSAGSGGHAFYWPQLKASYEGAADHMRAMLERLFDIHRKRTLAVVGLALGSWIGGDVLSWSLKDVALSARYPFAVFSPGNRHDEIIAMLNAASGMVDQFLLICCPSAISHLILRAEQSGTPLPLAKLRYLVIGEAFPENLRTSLERQAGCPPEAVLMASVYGSADTGTLGFESAASIMLRKLCEIDARVAERLSLRGVTPHFFHQVDQSTYLESVDGELCVTKWQGIPLVRYNIHDRAQLFDWQEIIDRLAGIEEPGPALSRTLEAMRAASTPLPCSGVIAIAGRADSALVLCGTKITEAMLDEAVRTPALAGSLTGSYLASVVMEDGRQRLHITLECPPGGKPLQTMADELYPPLIQAIGRVQPEFMDDWRNIYRNWDDDPEHRILKIDAVAWPALSQQREGDIKKHSILS